MAIQGNITSALTVADLNTQVNHEPRVSDLKLGFSLGMKNPASAMRQLIERHRAGLERFGIVLTTVVKTSALGGRPGKTYWLNKKQALYLCTKSEAPLATETTIQMVEVFDEYLTGKLRPVKVREHRRSLPTPAKIPERFGSDPNLLRDMVSALMSAHLRVEKGQSPDFGQALLQVFEDLSLAKDQPGWRNRGAMLDWNWNRAEAGFAEKRQQSEPTLPRLGLAH